MPFTVQQLIEGRQNPVTVLVSDSAQTALELMIEHDFSQLPVLEENNEPLGIVTSDSILRALNHFGISINELKVSHAIVKVDDYSPDEDLFDLLDDLRDTYAVLIVDSERKLLGIVTSYDTTEYFRRRAEDMMYVEDIETTLREYIRTAFTNQAGELDQQELNSVLVEIADGELRKKFNSALRYYYNLHTKTSGPIDKGLIEQVFNKYFVAKSEPKSIEDLTLSEHIQLLLHKSKWPYFDPIFLLKPEAIRTLLDSVRKTRNELAHFHGEISPQQRDQLHYCAEWLSQSQPKVSTSPINGVVKAEQVATDLVTLPSVMKETDTKSDMPAPVEEEISPKESRYVLLALWLQRQSVVNNSVELTFKQIEDIIGDELPTSAKRHRAWWANDSVSHIQSQQWLEAGWRVSNINLAGERIVFARIKEREKSYISFFSAVLLELQKAPLFSTKKPSPDGASWITLMWLLEGGPQVANLSFSFARRGRFRVELYIDSGDKEKNKHIFDELITHKSDIQAQLENLSGSLEWERIDDKRASRIALYQPGAITDGPDKLLHLQKWAVDAMLRFRPIIERYLKEVLGK